MKKTFQCIKIHIYQIVSDVSFWVLVLATCLLLLLTEVTYWDISGEEHTNVLQLIFVKGRDWIYESLDVSRQELFLSQPQRTFCDYIVVLTALPFVRLVFGERQSGMLRNRIYREGNTRFNLTRVVSGICMGGAVVFFGQLLFYLILCLFFPDMGQIYDKEAILAMYGQKNVTMLLIEQGSKIVLLGCIASCFSIILSAFTKDIYVCLMCPFLLCWLSTILQSYLSGVLYTEYAEEGGRIWGMLGWIQEHGTLQSIAWLPLMDTGIVCIVFVVLSCLIFTVRMSVRRDLGE